MKAIILAGGFGKRLRPLTDNRPKPLIEILGKPILSWQLMWLKKHRIEEIILCISYMKEKIKQFVGNGERFGVKVDYSIEEDPLGTGGALKNAESLLSNSERIIVLNGDVLTDLDPLALNGVLSEHLIGSMAVIPLRSPFGIVTTSSKNIIEGFREKPLLEDYWINGGVYCLNPEIFEYLPEKGNIEKTAFPQLSKEGKLIVVKYQDGFWKSIDNHKDIEEAEMSLSGISQK